MAETPALVLDNVDVYLAESASKQCAEFYEATALSSSTLQAFHILLGLLGKFEAVDTTSPETMLNSISKCFKEIAKEDIRKPLSDVSSWVLVGAGEGKGI